MNGPDGKTHTKIGKTARPFYSHWPETGYTGANFKDGKTAKIR